MKNLIKVLFAAAVLFFVGCSNDPAPTGGGTGGIGGGGTGGPGGGGGGGNVNVTVSLAQDNQGNIYFEFAPAQASVITKVKAECQQAGVNESVDITTGEVYSTQQPLYVGPVTVIQVGQQWKFTITGKVGNAQGQAFTSTVNYTINQG